MPFMDWVHGTLDVGGMVPVIGEVADGVNAGIYAAEGDLLNAGVSLAGMWPFGGQAVTGTRLGVKGVKVGKEILEEAAQKGAKEVAEEAVEQGAKKAGKEAAEEGAEAGAKDVGTKVSEAPPNGGAGGGAAAKKEPDFVVTEDGVAIPKDPDKLKDGLGKLDDVSTSPDTSRKFTGQDDKGPIRIRIEKGHAPDPNFKGTPDPLHTVDHMHIDRRRNGSSGPWESKEKLPYDWPF